jgi:hypothetical protein
LQCANGALLSPRHQVGESRSARHGEVLPPLAGGQIHQHVGQGGVGADHLLVLYPRAMLTIDLTDDELAAMTARPSGAAA